MSTFTSRAAIALALPLAMLACQSPQLVEQQPAARSEAAARIATSGRHIVLFRDDIQALARLLPDENTDYNGRIAIMRSFISGAVNAEMARRAEHIYTFGVHGFALSLSPQEINMLRSLPFVQAVKEDNVIVFDDPTELEAVAENAPGTGLRPQLTPWGITRVGGFQNFITPSRRAWIVDSGIDLEHPDLNVDVPLSRSFVSYTTSPDDDNFHGTHVAGTVAAKNNDFGVVGVAAGAKVVAIKCFNQGGSAFSSDILAGIDYVGVLAGAGDVVNCSFGGFGERDYNASIRRVARKGVRFAISAGNSARDANLFSPAMVNGWNIFTVSATDINDRFASFSNFGNPPIDFAAPGVRVSSTIPLNLFTQLGGYGSTSGTSMSAPHVAGILLVNGGMVYRNGTAIGDPDGNPDPIASLKWTGQ